MNVITIPKNISEQGELVILSRKEYEILVAGKEKKIKEISLNAIQKKALQEGRKEFKQNKTLSLNELRKELGFAH